MSTANLLLRTRFFIMASVWMKKSISFGILFVTKLSLLRRSFSGLLFQLLNASLSVREVWDSITRPVKSHAVSPLTRHRCDVSSALCCPGAKTRKWVPPLVIRFVVIMPVAYSMKIF